MQHPEAIGGSADDTSGAARDAAYRPGHERGLRIVPPLGEDVEPASDRAAVSSARSDEDPTDDAVLSWRLLGFLMTMGAVVGSLTMLTPHPTGYSETEIFIAIGIAFAGGAASFAAAPRLGRALLAPAVLASTLMVTFAAYSAGGVGGWFALFYVWVAVYSFYFLPPRTASLQLAAIGVAYAVLLISLPLAQEFWIGRWIAMMTTLAVTGGLVYTLVARGKRTTAELRELAVERTQLARRLERMARTDELTGLPNRRGWDEGLAREIARADRTGEPLCVALLDIDRFKDFNDRYGHLAGDELLRSLAPAWRGHLRDSDFLIRFGGEEFAVALPDCTLEDAGHLLERLRAAMPGGQTCSAGVAEWNGSEDPRALVDRADRALYSAKHSGRDRVAAA
ncbi:GGDEF domain-containing protein [Thermoleophilia bacterium SCSIO 60948]|nr:GGDEF domain-containing protein [Thermoleophilia bacterium SCSIO 60948]